MSNKRRHTKSSKKDRREMAEKLLVERAKRSSKEQLQTLDKRLGTNQGAQKERARLKNLVKAEK